GQMQLAAYPPDAWVPPQNDRPQISQQTPKSVVRRQMRQLVNQNRALTFRIEPRDEIRRQADRRSKEAERDWADLTFEFNNPHTAHHAQDPSHLPDAPQ